ncbi:hypothetical protein GGS24DRAFT_509333 [Hypoxylon argillaceum]|nr:hypothetical protein GGS24DRAFT_509333 [Hypoxylon argillaceum]
MPVAQLFLLGSLLRELAEGRLSKKYIEQYKPFPLPTEDTRLFDASDVSIIVPTVSWDPQTFPRALVSWLVNNPREIIIVTVWSEERKTRALLDSAPIQETIKDTDLKLLSIGWANKRDQLVTGIRASRGRITALVDDDAFWRPMTLLHLLAPFQEPDVGLVGTQIESFVPEERQNSSTITVWEVAALRNRSRRRDRIKAFYAADNSTNFTISGATMLLRAVIAADPDFQNELTLETFRRVVQITGDDSFITRWVLFQHLRNDRRHLKKWRLGVQITPEAYVSTALTTDIRFVCQMKRWLRTGLRMRLTLLFSEPGIIAFVRTAPYMALKMVEGLLNPFLNVLWYLSFFMTVNQRPFLALLLALYYLYGFASGLLAFAEEFPYCGRKIWAAVVADKVCLVSDFYCWATLFVENWASRPGVDKGQSKERFVIE